MKKTLQIKLMIIENFIDHYTSHIATREKMKQTARDYVEEDHVDEIDQAGFVTAKDLISSPVKVNGEKIRNIKATSVEQGLVVRFNEDHKNKLVDEELIHFNGFEWKFFDDDLDKVRELAEY